MTELGPTLGRRQLGLELQRLRNEAGMTLDQAAAELDCSRARVGHIESGRNPIRRPELIVLRDLYSIPAEIYSALEDIRSHASSRHEWWSTYKLPGWLKTYVGLEADARRIRNFEVELIPGLLQTEAYARRLHIALMGTSSPEEVDRYVASRLRRQARLHDEPAIDYAAVISEAAFRRAMADPNGVGRGQIEHLLELVERNGVRLHVLPYAAGLHPSQSGSFVVLGFDHTFADVGYQEYAFGGHLVEDRSAVGRLSSLWDTLRGLSLSAEDSVEWLSSLL